MAFDNVPVAARSTAFFRRHVLPQHTAIRHARVHRSAPPCQRVLSLASCADSGAKRRTGAGVRSYGARTYSSAGRVDRGTYRARPATTCGHLRCRARRVWASAEISSANQPRAAIATLAPECSDRSTGPSFAIHGLLDAQSNGRRRHPRSARRSGSRRCPERPVRRPRRR